ncbi:hypothetical protein OHT57_22840 [Streptomyces sp. NBC_00285]|nr:hypothetical protein [Streptomyces sp. NBC_00285]
MTIRTRTLAPLTALAATALVPLSPTAAQAQAQAQSRPHRARPSAVTAA